MDTLIVDGYNVINAWPELNKLKEKNLSLARDRLIQWMASYAACKGLAIIVVFDACGVKGELERYSDISGVQVVFSKEGETADSVIEKLTYELLKERNVFVATADWAEQLTVLVSGAFRVSVRELRTSVLDTAREIAEKHGETAGHRRTLEGRLQKGVIQRLEEIRRRRCSLKPEKR